MKIAVVVHGRFHAFDLARELSGLGHEVVLLTNYPKRWTQKFGIPAQHVRSLLAHGLLFRTALALAKPTGNEKLWEPFFHQWFGSWAAKTIAKTPSNICHSFSGISEEILNSKNQKLKIRSVVRGSSHIKTQKQILNEEQKRTGIDAGAPSVWMEQREIREYKKADLIITLSNWCQETFFNHGFREDKVIVIRSGNQLEKFRPVPKVLEQRLARIRTGAPIRVLTTGSVNLRKGLWDALKVFAGAPNGMEFTWVGEIHPEVKALLIKKATLCTFHPRVPQFELNKFYAEADLFMTLSLEEGYASVIGQALASGLPVLATCHAGVDHIKDGENGWVIPIRRPDLALWRLRWIQEHRDEYLEMVSKCSRNPGIKDWRDTAKKLVQAYDIYLRKNENFSEDYN